MTQKFEIKKQLTGEVIFSYDIPDGMESEAIARHALEKAVAENVNLCDANLENVNLRNVNLCDANLRGSSLVGTNLENANLRNANLENVNLCDANLENVNLRNANLRDANLCDAKNTPFTISGLRWFVVIGGTGYMQIGCQSHPVEAWKNFTDEEINRMDRYALDFWIKYKSMILAACDTHVHAKE